MNKIGIFMTMLILLINEGVAYGFDNIESHPMITDKAVYFLPRLNNFLKWNLNLSKGIETILPENGNKSVVELIRTVRVKFLHLTFTLSITFPTSSEWLDLAYPGSDN
jgi:predicted transporter